MGEITGEFFQARLIDHSEAYDDDTHDLRGFKLERERIAAQLEAAKYTADKSLEEAKVHAEAMVEVAEMRAAASRFAAVAGVVANGVSKLIPGKSTVIEIEG